MIQRIENRLLGVYNFFSVLFHTLSQIPKVVKNPNVLINEMYKIGVDSFALVVLVSIFTGIITALQASYQFKDFGAPETLFGMAVLKAIVVELSPVLTSLILVSKITSSTSAEIGTMAITEQLDAMKLLNLQPERFILAPKLVAGIIMIPILIVFADFFAVAGAWLTSDAIVGIESRVFLIGIKKFFNPQDFIVGAIKSFSFAAVLTFIGAYFGYIAKNGAYGVGKNTQKAVVMADVAILMFDFIITYFSI